MQYRFLNLQPSPGEPSEPWGIQHPKRWPQFFFCMGLNPAPKDAIRNVLKSQKWDISMLFTRVVLFYPFFGVTFLSQFPWLIIILATIPAESHGFCSGIASKKWLTGPSPLAGWWFGTFFIFPYIGNNHPNWLIFFRGVQTTNQLISYFLNPHLFMNSNPQFFMNYNCYNC